MGRVKLVFLISNCFSGFGYGIFMFAFGVGNCVLSATDGLYIGNIVVGLLLTVLALFGCWGASNDNKKMLDTYALIMGLLSLGEIIHLVILSHDREKLEPYDNFLKKAFFVALIFTTIVTIVSSFLAFVLSIQIVMRRARAEGLAMAAMAAANKSREGSTSQA